MAYLCLLLREFSWTRNLPGLGDIWRQQVPIASRIGQPRVLLACCDVLVAVLHTGCSTPGAGGVRGDAFSPAPVERSLGAALRLLVFGRSVASAEWGMSLILPGCWPTHRQGAATNKVACITSPLDNQEGFYLPIDSIRIDSGF